jgi:hypothetical protein
MVTDGQMTIMCIIFYVINNLMIIDKSVPKKYIIRVLIVTIINLKYFLHSDDWLPWQQPLRLYIRQFYKGFN